MKLYKLYQNKAGLSPCTQKTTSICTLWYYKTTLISVYNTNETMKDLTQGLDILCHALKCLNLRDVISDWSFTCP